MVAVVMANDNDITTTSYLYIARNLHVVNGLQQWV